MHSFPPLSARLLSALPGPLPGILLALVSTLLFVIVGILVRMLSDSINLFEILLFRQLVFISLLLPAIQRNLASLLKPHHLGLHSLRIAGAFTALYLGFVTVSNLPLADATALGFCQVLFVALIARLTLAENLSTSRLLTLLIGFAGVMMVVRPSFADASLIYILAGLLGALGAAVAVICVRRIVQHESRIALLAYQAVFVGLLAVLPAILNWQWPSGEEWLLLLAIGVISSIAQWIGVTAYKFGEANVIANVEYAKMLYALLLGYWLFAETPDSLALAGAALILLSALIPALLSRRSQPQPQN